MAVASGRTIDRIVYIHNGTTPIKRVIDESTGKQEEIYVSPAFPADADDEKNVATGEKWAENSGSWIRNSDGSYSRASKSGVQKTSIIENKPKSGYIITNIESRGNSGRAYKVISPEGMYVDMREDAILDIIFNAGVAKGGEILTELIWVRIGGQNKLVRYNSPLHNAAVEAESRKGLKPIKVADLVPNTIYADKAGNEYLYCGQADTYRVDYNNIKTYRRNVPLMIGLFTWGCGSNKTVDEILEQARVQPSSCPFSFDEKPKLVKEKGVVNPQNWHAIARETGQKAVKDRPSHMYYYSQAAHTVKSGEPIKILDEFK